MCIDFEVLKKRVLKETDYGKDPREPYLRDRDRILFSRAFRRLALKTQIVTIYSREISDHIRSRLTHSLEVMQIASSLALEVNKLFNYKSNSKRSSYAMPYYGVNNVSQRSTQGHARNLNVNLVEAIAFGHDIGHTPYGHVGEETLFEFVFPDSGFLNLEKLRHCFQSLKVCCFLEKQYCPDFYGLNLTVATLDGIFKHSNLESSEMKFYKDLFDQYCEVFWDSKSVNEDVLNKLKSYLFEYSSPVTFEGVIVSIADEVAQMCHDLEDLRRIVGFDSIKDVYSKVIDMMEDIKISEISCILADFKSTFEDVCKGKREKLIKLERLYVKLILNICLISIPEVVSSLMLLEDNLYKKIKNKYLGKFNALSDIAKQLDVDETVIDLLKVLNRIFKTIFKDNKDEEKILIYKNIFRWDIKGRAICKELSEKLLEIIENRLNKINTNKGITEEAFSLVEPELRESLKKSYQVGEKFVELLKSLSLPYVNSNISAKDLEHLPVKIAIWDYIAGMTDSYIINEYESLTFRKVSVD